jgi:hypothetical protein
MVECPSSDARVSELGQHPVFDPARRARVAARIESPPRSSPLGVGFSLSAIARSQTMRPLSSCREPHRIGIAADLDPIVEQQVVRVLARGKPLNVANKKARKTQFDRAARMSGIG